MNSHSYGYLVFIKPEIHTGKQTASSTNGAGQTGCLRVEECKQIYTHRPAQNSRLRS